MKGTLTTPRTVVKRPWVFWRTVFASVCNVFLLLFLWYICWFGVFPGYGTREFYIIGTPWFIAFLWDVLLLSYKSFLLQGDVLLVHLNDTYIFKLVQKCVTLYVEQVSWFIFTVWYFSRSELELIVSGLFTAVYILEAIYVILSRGYLGWSPYKYADTTVIP